MQFLRTWYAAHVRLTWVIAVVTASGLAYLFWPSADTTPKYVLESASYQDLVVLLSGTGQVVSQDEVEVTPRVSGDLSQVWVKEGDVVKEGQVIALLDDRVAQKSLRDARIALETARLELEELKKPTDALVILKAEHALARAEEDATQGVLAQEKAYEDAFTTISNSFLDLPGVMSGLHDTLFTTNSALSLNEQNLDFYTSAVGRYDEKAYAYRTDMKSKYDLARKEYDAVFARYKSTDRSASRTELEALLQDTYRTTKAVADAVKSASDVIQFYRDTLTARNLTPMTLSTTHLSTLNGYLGKVNTHVSSLLAMTSTLSDSAQTIIDARRSVLELSAELDDVNDGVDLLEIRAAEIAVKQKVDALYDAELALADYRVKAPFGGIISTLAVTRGMQVTSATVIGTLITDGEIASIELNEVDAARVRVGATTTLSFDALDEYTLVGKVARIDGVGTVAQGVVTYTADIVFSDADERVKPGMSVSADIEIARSAHVLVVPSSAVKENPKGSFVEILPGVTPTERSRDGIASQVPPLKVFVTVGLSNDTHVEIVEGVREGESVIVRTMTPLEAGGTQAPSILQAGRPSNTAQRTPGFRSF
jgi:RND family efflux transporter MFP subunit